MNPLGWLVLLHVSVAGAVRPPMDYAVDVDGDLAKPLAELNASHAYRETLSRADTIGRTMGVLPQVAYEAGYAHNQLGHIDAALEQYGAAIEADPKHAAARYDRGEIYISLGRWTDARADFIHVVAEQPTHWAGHFRLAHVAGVLGESDAFERHLTEAIRHGLSLSVLAADPTWRSFGTDPQVGGVLRKILVLYGNDELLREFGGEQ